MRIKIALFLILSMISTSSFAATWYVRADGGTRTQCTGQADAAYPGSGTAQACAYNNFRLLYTDEVTQAWVISGGDTVIVKDGPWRVGALTSAGSMDSATPAIPSGTSGAHTKILGGNYANCTTKTQIHAGYAAWDVFNIKDSQYVDLQCLDLTDYAQCSKVGAISAIACAASAPYEDYSRYGIVSNTGTGNILLKDVNIHGFAAAGWIGPIGGDIHLENSNISYNPSAGINLDAGDGFYSTGGTYYITDSILEFNGCVEEYPITHSIPAYKCIDQNVGGYGDAIGTATSDASSFNINRSIVRYNTQDGPDLLHSSNGTLTITHSKIYGNMGQQVKAGATSSTVINNNEIIADCKRMSLPISGTPDGYNEYLTNFCRAAGQGLAIAWNDSGTFEITYNTIVGYPSTFISVLCSVADCTPTTGTHVFSNNIVKGYSLTGYNTQFPNLTSYDSGAHPAPTSAMWTERSHNIYSGIRASTIPTNTGGYTGDPGLVSVPSADNLDYANGLDSLDLHLISASGAINAGVTIGSITDDYEGNARPYQSLYDIGAHEWQGQTDFTPAVVSASVSGGRYQSPQSTTLSANETATIYYTKDGSTPTQSSAVYSGPVTVLQNQATTVLKYIAKDAAGNVSAVQTQTYKCQVCR